MTPRIEGYALIGDCQTAALVGRDGSIDWLCFPRFDSPACFAALLGAPDNGRWLLAPAERVSETRRSYRGETLVLDTTFTTATGEVTVVDFMPEVDPVDKTRNRDDQPTDRCPQRNARCAVARERQRQRRMHTHAEDHAAADGRRSGDRGAPGRALSHAW